jgi:2-polyprenyl-3-methyl-5-hydroxy-6-metoxy-1,4-benzoquinol methylase
MTDYTIQNPAPFPLTQGDIIQDYLEWSGEDEFVVATKIANFRAQSKLDYAKYGKDFYAKTENYIYDILGGNPSKIERANLLNRFIPNCIEIIQKHPGRKFADFGGGVGAVCSIVSEASDKEVSYIDLECKMTDFARWRFKKHNQNVDVVIIEEQEFTLPEKYDLILTDAVWEHLPPAVQYEYAVRLTNYLNPGGLFFLLIDLSGENPEMPMHFNVDIARLHSTLEQAGLEVHFGRNNFASLWLKR